MNIPHARLLKKTTPEPLYYMNYYNMVLDTVNLLFSWLFIFLLLSSWTFSRQFIFADCRAGYAKQSTIYPYPHFAAINFCAFLFLAKGRGGNEVVYSIHVTGISAGSQSFKTSFTIALDIVCFGTLSQKFASN